MAQATLFTGLVSFSSQDLLNRHTLVALRVKLRTLTCVVAPQLLARQTCAA